MKTDKLFPTHSSLAAALVVLAALLIQFAPASAWATTATINYTTVGTTTWTCPPGVTTISVAVQGGGGAGGGSGSGNNYNGAGGGGGGCAYTNAMTVVPGTVYTVTVGGGGVGAGGTGPAGGASSFSGTGITTLTGGGGGGGGFGNAGAAGTGGTPTGGGTANFSGGNGAAASGGGTTGGGGGGAGTTSIGGTTTTTAGGGAGTGSPAGGAGASLPAAESNGNTGGFPGGGGSGGRRTTVSKNGGNGGNGQVTITYTAFQKANNATALNVGSSWVDTTVPTSAQVATWNSTVATAANATNTLGADLTFAGISIVNPVVAVNLNAGNTLTLGAAASDIDMTAATQDLTLNCGLILGAANVWDVATGRTLTVAGAVSGGFDITKQGAGTAILSGPNTSYSGNTTINAGILQADNNAALGTGLLVMNGGTLSNNVASIVLTNPVNLLAASSVGVPAGTNFTLGGIITNTGALTKTGTGTLTLTNANTYSGVTTISAGTLKLANVNAVQNSSLVTFVGTLQLATDTAFAQGAGTAFTINAGTLVSDRATAGAGLTHAFAGTLSISHATQNFTAGANVTSGTAAIQVASMNCGSGGGGTATLNPTTANFIDTGGYTGFANAGTSGLTLGGTSLGNRIDGDITLGTRTSINLTKNTASKWTLSGNNSYNGGTALSAGTLQFSKLVSMPASGAVALSGTGTLAVNVGGSGEWTTGTSGNGTIGGLLAGLGGQSGGTVTWAGTVALGLDTGNASPTTQTYSGAIANLGTTLGLTKLGANTLTLPGLSATPANNYAGTTIIDNGTLAITTTSPALTGGLTFGASATTPNVGTLDLSAASATFGGACVVQTTNAAATNVITLGSGQTLQLNGAVTVGVNPSANTTTTLAATGAGTLSIGTSVIPTANNLLIGNGNLSSSFNNAAILDLSGLTNFYANLGSGTFRLGSLGNTPGSVATAILAATNTIQATLLTVGGADSGVTQTLRLGSGTNVLNVTTLSVVGSGSGDGRASGTLNFNTANGGLQVRGLAGGSARADLNVGNMAMNSSATPTGLFDVTGHSADLRFGSMNIGFRTSGSGLVQGEFKFDTGTLDADNLAVGVRNTATATGIVTLGGGSVTINTLTSAIRLGSTANTAGTGTGTLNISGGTVTVAANGGNSIILGNAAFAGATGNGTLNLTGGTLTVAGNIVRGLTTGTSTAVLALNGAGAILDMGGNNITNMTSFTYTDGTLKNLGVVVNTGISLAGTGARVFDQGASVSGTISGTISGSGVGLTKNGTGSLTLSGAPNYGGQTTINAGKLVFSTAGSGAVTTDVSVTGSGATNSLLVATANAQWATSGSLTQNSGSALEVNYGSTLPSTTTAPIQVNNFTVGSGLTLKVAGVGFSEGQDYPLVTWTGTGPGVATAFTTVILPASPAVTGYLTVSGNTLYLHVSTVAALSWNTGNSDWDTTSYNWTNTFLNVAAQYGDGTDAVLFGDADGATGNPVVTLASAFSPLGVKMKSSSHDYTISGSGSIGGSLPLILDAANTRILTLATSNSYTGGTIIGGGTLALSAPGTLGSTNGSVTLSGGQLDLGGLTRTNATVTISAAAASGDTITNGTLSATAYAVNNPAGNPNISANLGGAGAFTKSGAGTVTLSGTNTYAGTTTISVGTLTIGGAGQLNNGSYAGPITNNAILNYNSSAAQTLSGIISGTGALNYLGAGTLTLSGANNYNGATTVTNGTVQLLKPGTITSSSGVTVYTNGTLLFNNSGATWSPANPLITLNGGTLTNYSSGNFWTVLNGNAVTVAAPSTIGVNNAGAVGNNCFFLDCGLKGSAPVTVQPGANGVGLVLRNTNSTYSGTITVNGNASATVGTGSGLVVGSYGVQNPNLTNVCSLPNASITVNGTMAMGQVGSDMSWGAGTGGNNSGTTFQMDALNGTGVVVANFTTAGSTRTLSLGNNNGSGTFSGVIAAGVNSTLSLIKNGSGTQTLSGANAYTGTTTISAGTLKLGVNSALPSGTAVTLGAATLDAQTFASSTGPLDVTNAGTINLGSGGALAFAASNGKTWSGGTLAITGTFVSGASLRFGTTSSGLTSGQLSQISAAGYTSFVLDANGYLVGLNTPSIIGVTASQSITYGTANVTLSGTVGAGVVYPANGETVNVTINGNTQPATISGGVGGFSVSFPTASIPYSASPYLITYAYAGNATTLNAATNDTSTALTVNMGASTVTLTGTSFTYDGSPKSPVIGISGSTGARSTNYVGIGATSYGPVDAAPPAVGTYILTVAVLSDANWVGATNNLNFTNNPVITASAGANGSISPNGATVVSYGGSQAFTITTNTGYYISDVLVDGSSVGATNSYTFSSVVTNHTIAASFVLACTTPTIVGGIDPGTTNVIAFNPVVFALTNVTGTAPLAYQWRSNNVDIASATNSSYTNLSVTVADAGNYQVVVTNDCGAITSSVAVLTVNKQTPLLATMPTAATITYGQMLTAASLSGGSVTNAAGATVTGSFAYTAPTTVPNAGAASQGVIFTPDDTNNYNNVSTSVSVTVNLAPLGITANNDSKTYGQTKTYGTGSSAYTITSGTLTNGDAISTVTITDTDGGGVATASAGGTYHLTPGALVFTTGSAANYSITYNAGTLLVSQASTLVGATSTNNPSGYKDAVAFTATLPASASGNVVFASTNGPISTNTLSSGSATSLSITNLPRGTNVITVAYLGDGNYVGSTNSLNQIVTNHPPVVNATSYTRNAAVQQIKIAVTNLLSNATDVDSDTLTLASVSATTNGVSLIVSGGLVMYYNTNAVSDEFTYTVTDGFGGTNSATVTLAVDSTPLFGQSVLASTTGGTATLNFAGIPTYSYSVLRSTNLTSWAEIWTTNAPGSGVFQYIDLAAPQPSAYYQLRYNP